MGTWGVKLLVGISPVGVKSIIKFSSIKKYYFVLLPVT